MAGTYRVLTAVAHNPDPVFYVDDGHPNCLFGFTVNAWYFWNEETEAEARTALAQYADELING